MKSKFIILIFILLACNVSANQVKRFFRISEIDFSLNSFVGTDYYIDTSDREFLYNEKSIFKFGSAFEITRDTKFWLELSARNRLLAKTVFLEKIGLSHQIDNWEVNYKYDRIGYGKLSELFSYNINDVYFDKYVLGEYKFNGVGFSYKSNKNVINTKIGGNEFNALLIDLNVNYSTDNSEYSFFYLHAGNNNELNYTMHSVGYEIEKRFYANLFRLYSASTYQYMPSQKGSSQTENFISLNELTVNPMSNIKFGTNYLFSKYNWDKKKWAQNQSFINLRIDNISFYLSYLYKNVDDFLIREINQITFYHIIDNWKIGINIAYFVPSLGKNYYQIGIQIDFYESIIN